MFLYVSLCHMSIAFFFFSYYMFDCTTRTRWFSMHVMHFVAGHCVLTHRHFLISPVTPVDCRASMGLAPPSCVSAHYLSCACCAPLPDRICFLASRGLLGGAGGRGAGFPLGSCTASAVYACTDAQGRSQSAQGVRVGLRLSGPSLPIG